jgi:hypothetical protein
MKTLSLMIVLALAAAPAWAQNRQTQTTPPGTHQGTPGGATQSSEFRDRANEQAATAPDAPRYYNRHPGRVTKFSSAGTVPEVQFDVDRREAKERAGKVQGR